MFNIFRTFIYTIIISSLLVVTSFGEDADDDFNGENVRFEKGLLSINVRDIRSEDLMKEVGEKCNIEIVVLGEVFSEIPISSGFKDVPVNAGIKRLLRCSGIANYLMHFDDADNGSKIVRLDLIGKKGGEKYLTDRSVEKKKTVDRSEKRKERAERKSRRKKKEEPPISRKEMEDLQESFMNVMDDVLKEKFMNGEQPDPAEVLRIFNEAVPPDIRAKMPPEVLEQLEGLQ